MKKLLVIVNGESFRNGGSNSRDKGDNDFYNLQQKIAVDSHLRLFEFIEINFKMHCYVFINSYVANGHEQKLLEWYGDKVVYHNFNYCNFTDEHEFINNTVENINNVNLNEYEYCLFIRPDYYLKNYYTQ